MRAERYAILAAMLLLSLLPRAAHGQDTVADVLSFLVTNQSIETGSVERDAAAARATSSTISRALLANLATLPVTSTSGAFLYRLNPDIGTVERATQNFGPLFLQRAITVGRGNAGVGLTFQHLRFTSLDGRNLRDGTLVTTANQFADESQPFDVDQLTLRIDADIATLYASAGLGDRVEVGAAAPLVWLRVEGSRVNTYRGRTFTQAAASATAIGLADVLVRAKVKAYEEEGLSLAAAVDARLPTGREADLLGTGRTSVRFSAIGSLEGETMSAHANAGVAVGGLATELLYGAALVGVASPRLTVSAEMVGRWIDTPGAIQTMSAPHPTLAGVQTLRLLPGTGGLQTLTFAPGVRWNVADTWVVTASVGIPLLKGGLRAPLMPFVGVDLTLAR
jgi:hypothetical protein